MGSGGSVGGQPSLIQLDYKEISAVHRRESHHEFDSTIGAVRGSAFRGGGTSKIREIQIVLGFCRGTPNSSFKLEALKKSDQIAIDFGFATFLNF